ncbi:MAG: response regulator transcription factor [Sarcina sp.]
MINQLDKANILVIEDDDDINQLIKEVLEEEGYTVKSAYSGTEGLLRLDVEKFNLGILDLMLPGKSGEEVLTEIRKSSEMPVIILSAKEEQGIKARNLRNGADDFVSKPFDIDELLARVEVNLRRGLNNKRENDEIFYKEISLNKEERIVLVNGGKVELTTIEFDILKILMENPKKVFSKVNLFKSVWGEDYICDDNTITVHISNLRNKISKAGAKEQYIKTVWGIGYRLDRN